MKSVVEFKTTSYELKTVMLGVCTCAQHCLSVAANTSCNEASDLSKLRLSQMLTHWAKVDKCKKKKT
jgi:hypothetical protein